MQFEAAFTRLFASRGRTFFFAARFLPRERRHGATALYAFCRTMDDLADELPPEIGVPALDDWIAWLTAVERGSTGAIPADPPNTAAGQAAALCAAVRELVEAYGVPPLVLRLLVEGVRADALRAEVRDFAELREYCFGVAGTVGLAMCHVLAAPPAAFDRAEKLGIAMQLTNVLRDVGEDLARGRVYLPADERARFGVTVERLHTRRTDAAFTRLMQFQVARARSYYAAGMPGVFLLPPECRLPILVAGRLYAAILARIEAQHYDVYSRRAATSGAEKLRTAAGAYVALRTMRWRTPSEVRPAAEVAVL